MIAIGICLWQAGCRRVESKFWFRLPGVIHFVVIGINPKKGSRKENREGRGEDRAEFHMHCFRAPK